MRNSILFLLMTLLTWNILSAQDNYPIDPIPGKCYIRCKVQETTKKTDFEIVPAYLSYTVSKPIYRTVQKQVEIRPASKRYEYVPAVYRDVIDSVLIVDPANKITVSSVKMVDAVDSIVTRQAFSRFESRPGVENCPDPRDCEVICWVIHPEEKKPISIKKIQQKPGYTQELQNGKHRKFTRRDLISAATVKETEIPAEYITIQKEELVQDWKVDSLETGAVTQEEVIFFPEEEDRSGGGRNPKYVWEVIDCDLTEFSVLPIFYDLNSATLTTESKRVIDERIYGLMARRKNIHVEINSHTDSRASDDFNVELSQRRAQLVVDYLVSKGIQTGRLIPHGFGETKLVNKCSNEVNCSEEEHAKNRRTEFRVRSNF